jgi:hypothetical protein
MPQAQAALESDEVVTVETGRWFVFRPAAGTPNAGFVLYPAGRVPAEAYAPLARALAKADYLAVVIPSPLNLAIFNPHAAADVIKAFPEVKHWAVGGHSLGGTAAADFAYEHPDLVDGLVLMAAYPPEDADLSGRDDLEVTLMYGPLDGLFRAKDVEQARQRLPQDTHEVVIVGGNHAYFGWYGDQPVDGSALISRVKQQTQTLAAIILTLDQIETRGTVTLTGHNSNLAR